MACLNSKTFNRSYIATKVGLNRKNIVRLRQKSLQPQQYQHKLPAPKTTSYNITTNDGDVI